MEPDVIHWLLEPVAPVGPWGPAIKLTITILEVVWRTIPVLELPAYTVKDWPGANKKLALFVNMIALYWVDAYCTPFTNT